MLRGLSDIGLHLPANIWTTLLSKMDDYDDWDLVFLKIRFKAFISYAVMLHDSEMLVWHKCDNDNTSK